MSLQLTIPEQHHYQDPTLELDEKRLRKWLGSMPVLDAGKSLRLVLGALEPLNEQRLDSTLRLRLLNVYYPTVKRLYDNAEPVRLRQQPLSRQQRQDIVDDVEKLCLGLANGFKIVLCEWVESSAEQLKKPHFPELLRRTVQQLGAVLVHSYRYYRDAPPQLFLELNQLYRLARHQGMHNSTREGTSVQYSLATTYQALYLLVLSNPASLAEGQTDQYYRTLLQYAQAARIVPGYSWQGVPEGLYFLDLKSDNGPQHCVFLKSPVSGADPHILDARVPLQEMHDMLTKLRPDRRDSRAETGILRTLLPEVGQRDKRKAPRSRSGNWIEAVVELNVIADWLSRKQQGEQPVVERWHVKDASAHGYRLVWSENAASLLQVGSLICVVDESSDEHAKVQLLVVRWLRNQRDEETELGVEKLPGVPSPVQVTVVDTGAQSPALFLPSTGVQGMSAKLVTTSSIYEPGGRLLIQVGEREIKVQCGERTEQGAGFDCFEFISSG